MFKNFHWLYNPYSGSALDLSLYVPVYGKPPEGKSKRIFPNRRINFLIDQKTGRNLQGFC